VPKLAFADVDEALLEESAAAAGVDSPTS